MSKLQNDTIRAEKTGAVAEATILIHNIVKESDKEHINSGMQYIGLTDKYDLYMDCYQHEIIAVERDK